MRNSADNNVQAKDTSNKPPKFPDQDPNRTGDQSSSTSRTVAENTDADEDIGVAVTANDCDPDDQPTKTNAKATETL